MILPTTSDNLDTAASRLSSARSTAAFVSSATNRFMLRLLEAAVFRGIRDSYASVISRAIDLFSSVTKRKRKASRERPIGARPFTVPDLIIIFGWTGLLVQTVL